MMKSLRELYFILCHGNKEGQLTEVSMMVELGTLESKYRFLAVVCFTRKHHELARDWYISLFIY